MEKKLYFNLSYEVQASLLFGFRFLFYNVIEGQGHKLVDKKVDYLQEEKQVSFLETLFSLDDIKYIENGLFKLTNFYKNTPHLINAASLFSLNEYVRTNNLLPASGELANSSDAFLHLIAYSLRAYAKEGKYLLDREETYANVEKITRFTHSNMRVIISHTIFFALLSKIYEFRILNNGKALRRRQVSEVIDQALRKVLYHYRDYQYLDELRYFVRLDKQLYDHATTILPSSQIRKINPKELRAGNYVVDTIETLLYTLLKFNRYRQGLTFISDIPGSSSYNLVLYTLLYSLTFGLPNEITSNINGDTLNQFATLKPLTERYKNRAFYPIKTTLSLISESVNDEEKVKSYAKQIEFEFERIGYNLSIFPLQTFRKPKSVDEAYYQLYVLVKTVKKYDVAFVGHIILINNTIK